MTITLTETAARQIRTQLTKQGGGLGLRVGIKTVGCSGLAYTYELAKDLHADEQAFEAHGATLLVETKNLAMLEGSRLDFVTEGLKQAFQFDNPNVAHACGCGESFNLKPGVAQGAVA